MVNHSHFESLIFFNNVPMPDDDNVDYVNHLQDVRRIVEMPLSPRGVLCNDRSEVLIVERRLR